MADSGLTLKFLSTPANVVLAGACIRAVCVASGLAASECNRVENGAVEGLNNVVEHAYENRPDGQIEVAIRLEGRRLVIEVVDEGLPNFQDGSGQLGFDPDDREHLPEGGLGMFIIRQTMDEVIYTAQGNHHVLSMTKYLPA